VSAFHRLRNNLAHVIGGELFLRAANAAVAIFIGRAYGARMLGIYAAILAVATLAERLADNGLELTAIAEVSRHPQSLRAVASAIYIDKIALSIAAIVLLVLAAWFLGFSHNRWGIASILTLRTFLYSFSRLNAGLLKALNKTKYIVRIQTLHCLLLVLSLPVIYLHRSGLLVLLLCLLGAQTVEFVLSSAVLMRCGLHRVNVSLSACWDMLRRATPVGLTYTFSTVMLRGDVVVLSFLVSVEQVGVFSSANTALIFAYVIAWLFSGVLLSDLGSFSQDRAAFDSHFRRCLYALLLLVIPAASVAILLSRPVILLLFGTAFAAATVPGALMMAALPFIFLNAAFLSRTVARDVSRLSLGIYGFTAVLSLFLNYLLGRSNGDVGVAVSILIREALITLLFVRFWNFGGPAVESAEPTRLQTA
jgi:O-antigen/teichoic acid export membrane protein